MVDTAMHSARLLLGLLNDVLDFSKIEAGQLVLEQVALAPATLIRQCVGSLAVQVQAKGLTQTATSTPECWLPSAATRSACASAAGAGP